MSIGRFLGWVVVAVLTYVPINWAILWHSGELSKDATLGSTLVGALVCWALAAGLGYFLVVSARGIKLRKAREQREFEALLAGPLQEIRPAKAILKPGEKAYGSVMATLEELQTVGYKSGTQGVSLHVAKGVTIRTGGTRGKAVKGMVGVSNGELVVTDQRIVFAGDMKSFSMVLADLISTTNYTDGFGFSDESRSYILQTKDDRARAVFAVVLQKVLSGRGEVTTAPA